jgi:molybdopterin molybdotransferase
MISYDQAIQLIISQAKPAPPTSVKADESLGMVCVERVVSRKNLPAFNSSAMDGFAVSATQTALATPDSPILALPVSQRIEAGAFHIDHRFGQCVEITTGAVVPDAFDAVIAYEQVDHIKYEAGTAKSINLSRAAKSHQNVRLKGEDIQIGSILIEPGTQIRASHIAAINQYPQGKSG